MANKGFWEDGKVWFSADNLNAMLLQFSDTVSRGDYGQQGREHFNTDTGVESYDTGSTWVDKQWGTGAYRDASVTNAKIDSMAASKLTGTLSSSRFANSTISSGRIISLDAGKLTGTISNSRFGGNSIDNSKISDLNMSKLRGDFTDIPGISVSTDAPTTGTGSHGDIWLQRLA